MDWFILCSKKKKEGEAEVTKKNVSINFFGIKFYVSINC